MTKYTKKKPKRNLWKLFKEHVRYSLSISSISGLNHVVRSNRSLFERIFWLAVFLTFLYFATTESLKGWDRYQDNAVVITVDKDYFSWTSYFPTATICYTQLAKEGYKTLSAQYPDLPDYNKAKKYLEDLAFKNYYSYSDYKKYANGSVKELLEPEAYLTAMNLVIPMTGPSKGKRAKLSFKYPLDQARLFYRIFTEKGPCTAFNPYIGVYYTYEYFNESIPYSNYSNIEYSYRDSASWAIREPTDFSVCLHASTEIVQITDKCIYCGAQRFKSSRLDVTNVWAHSEVESLTLRQRKCRFPHEAETLRHSPVYSYNLCRVECRIELCLKYCGCTPYYYRRLPGEPICNMTGMYCLSQYANIIVNLREPKGPNSTEYVSICNCLQNCNSSIFSEAEVLKDQSFLLQSVIEIFITYPDTAYERHLIFSHTDLIGPSNLCCTDFLVLVQVGGIFGLFLGFSVLSLMELFYFLTLRFFWALRNRV